MCYLKKEMARICVPRPMHLSRKVASILCHATGLSNSTAFPFPTTHVLSAGKSTSRFSSLLELMKLTCFVNGVLFQILRTMVHYLTKVDCRISKNGYHINRIVILLPSVSSSIIIRIPRFPKFMKFIVLQLVTLAEASPFSYMAIKIENESNV